MPPQGNHTTISWTTLEGSSVQSVQSIRFLLLNQTENNMYLSAEWGREFYTSFRTRSLQFPRRFSNNYPCLLTYQLTGRLFSYSFGVIKGTYTAKIQVLSEINSTLNFNFSLKKIELKGLILTNVFLQLLQMLTIPSDLFLQFLQICYFSLV